MKLWHLKKHKDVKLAENWVKDILAKLLVWDKKNSNEPKIGF